MIEQSCLKLIDIQSPLNRPHAFHDIYRCLKFSAVGKQAPQHKKTQIFKKLSVPEKSETNLKQDLANAFIEVVAGEFFRLILPHSQPKTRLSYSPQLAEYGLLSSEISKFISLEYALAFKNKKENPKPFYFNRFKQYMNHIGLGNLLIISVWLGEFDLKPDNLGWDMVRALQLYKIDHGCCLPATWTKYRFNPNCEGYYPNVEGLQITNEVLKALPQPGPYQAFHWFHTLKEGKPTEGACEFLDPSSVTVLQACQFFNGEMTSTLLKILLIDEGTINRFVSICKMQFLNIHDLDGSLNDFINEVACDICLELNDRSIQLQTAAFENKSFLKFLETPAKEEIIDNFRAHLPNFVLFKKFRLNSPIRDPEELRPLSRFSHLPFCGVPLAGSPLKFYSEEQKHELMTLCIPYTKPAYQFFPNPREVKAEGATEAKVVENSAP